MTRLIVFISAALLAASLAPAIAGETAPDPAPAPDFEAMAFDAGAESGIEIASIPESTDEGLHPAASIAAAGVCAAIFGGGSLLAFTW